MSESNRKFLQSRTNLAARPTLAAPRWESASAARAVRQSLEGPSVKIRTMPDSTKLQALVLLDCRLYLVLLICRHHEHELLNCADRTATARKAYLQGSRSLIAHLFLDLLFHLLLHRFHCSGRSLLEQLWNLGCRVEPSRASAEQA